MASGIAMTIIIPATIIFILINYGIQKEDVGLAGSYIRLKLVQETRRLGRDL